MNPKRRIVIQRRKNAASIHPARPNCQSNEPHFSAWLRPTYGQRTTWGAEKSRQSDGRHRYGKKHATRCNSSRFVTIQSGQEKTSHASTIDSLSAIDGWRDQWSSQEKVKILIADGKKRKSYLSWNVTEVRDYRNIHHDSRRCCLLSVNDQKI